MSESVLKSISPDFLGEVYKAVDGWRWRVTSSHNGLVVATSGEAYENKAHAVHMIDRLWPTAAAPVVAVDVIAEEAAEAIDKALRDRS